MRRLNLVLVICSLLIISLVAPSWSASEMLSQLVAGRVTTAPVMDGRIDDPAWTGVSESSEFIRLGTQGSLAKAQTYVKAVTDGKALYIAFRCKEPRISEVKASRGTEDGGILAQESVETVIDPAGNGATFYHFIGNIFAEKYNSLLTTYLTGSPKEDPEWKGNWSVKTSRGKGEWFAEFCIPFSTIGVNLGKNSRFLINFSRTRHIEFENSSWSATRVSFVEPANVGDLIIPSADSSYFRIEYPKLASTVTGSQDVLLRLYNHTKSSVQPRLTYLMSGPKTITGNLQLSKIAAGKTASFLLPLKVDNTGSYKLHVSAIDSATGASLYSFSRAVEVTQPIVFDEALYALYHHRADANVMVKIPIGTQTYESIYSMKEAICPLPVRPSTPHRPAV